MVILQSVSARRAAAGVLVLCLATAHAADIWLIAMANPAAVACKEAGGTISKIYTDKGEQGMCTLPSGTVCEEWAFFKGACGQDKSLQTQPATQTDKPASSPADKN
jgi:putative hemolysin